MDELRCTNEEVGRLIVRYELGALKEPEREVFVEHLFECSYCHDEVFEMEPFMNSLRANAASIRAESQLLIRRHTRKRVVLIGACASLLVMLCLAGFWYLRQREAQTSEDVAARIRVPMADYVSEPDVPMRATGNAFRSAMKRYQDQDFATAAKELGAIALLEPDNDQAWFYEGVSLLLIGKSGEAVDALKESINRAPPQRRESCRFYLAVAYAKSGRTEKAIAEASAVVEMNGSHRSAAIELRRDLSLR